MNYIYAKHFRQFEDFTVEKIYKPYRKGGVEIDGKFVGKTFKEQDGKYYEEEWIEGKPVLKAEPTQFNRELFATYKKVFDVQISTPSEVTVDGKTGKEFVLNGLGTYKVKEMLRTDFDLDIPMNGDKELFDWEDGKYKYLEGKSFKMKVTGTGLDTSYKFKLVGEKSQPKEVEKKPVEVEDLPF